MQSVNFVQSPTTAEELHVWYGFSGNYRHSLTVNPDGQYFRVADYRGNLGCLPDVYLVGRQWAVKLASKHNAPDSALERLGVKVLTLPTSDDPFSLNHSELVWPKKVPFGWRTLLKHHDGRFWLFKNFELLGMRVESGSPMSQREAIAWAHGNGAWLEDLHMLGVED